VALNARNAEIYVHALTALADARQTIEQSHPSIRFDTIDLGGGFAAPDDSGVEGILREIGAHFGSLFPDCRLALEPGRLLVSDAGFVVTSVTVVIEISGHHFVFVDAGTNVLIPIPTARYRVLHPAPHVADGFVCDVVDGITSPSNVIVRGAKVSAKPRKGDRWILAGAGAYTSSMSAFWGFMPFPVQWLDSQGRRSVLLSRETIAAAGATLLGL
jgi:diaminopimelate decarboxylase/aspartate kinase